MLTRLTDLDQGAERGVGDVVATARAEDPMLTGVYTVEFSGRVAEPARRNTSPTTSTSPRTRRRSGAGASKMRIVG